MGQNGHDADNGGDDGAVVVGGHRWLVPPPDPCGWLPQNSFGGMISQRGEGDDVREYITKT